MNQEVIKGNKSSFFCAITTNGPAIKGVSVPAIGGVARFLPSKYKVLWAVRASARPDVEAVGDRKFVESRSQVKGY
jgi:hypothetical protein